MPKANTITIVKRQKDTLSLDILQKYCGKGWKMEYAFHPTRKWRFDYAHPVAKIAIEVEGAVWTNGRHTRGTGFTKDMEKYNAAAIAGWRLLRYTPAQMGQLAFIADVKEMMKNEVY